MRKSRFTEEQIIGVLKGHQAGLPVAEPLPPIQPIQVSENPLALRLAPTSQARGKSKRALRPMSCPVGVRSDSAAAAGELSLAGTATLKFGLWSPVHAACLISPVFPGLDRRAVT